MMIIFLITRNTPRGARSARYFNFLKYLRLDPVDHDDVMMTFLERRGNASDGRVGGWLSGRGGAGRGERE